MTQTTTQTPNITEEIFHACPVCKKLELDLGSTGMATLRCKCGHKLTAFLNELEDWVLASEEWNGIVSEAWREKTRAENENVVRKLEGSCKTDE